MRPLPQGWREIAQRVNAECNAFPYKAEPPGQDVWGDLSESDSDCDNYAISKFRALLRAGIPVERLRLAICILPRSSTGAQPEKHLVAVIDAPSDQHILSNNVTRLMVPADLVAKLWEQDIIQVLDEQEPESPAWMRRQWKPWEKQ